MFHDRHAATLWRVAENFPGFPSSRFHWQPERLPDGPVVRNAAPGHPLGEIARSIGHVVTPSGPTNIAGSRKDACTVSRGFPRYPLTGGSQYRDPLGRRQIRKIKKIPAGVTGGKFCNANSRYALRGPRWQHGTEDGLTIYSHRRLCGKGGWLVCWGSFRSWCRRRRASP